MKNLAKLEKLNLTPVFHYEGRATICLLVDKSKRSLSRGIAICSNRDNFSKKIGRMKALGVALQTYEHQTNMGLISPNAYRKQALTSADRDTLGSFAIRYEYRGAYLPKLTPVETKLVEKKTIPESTKVHEVYVILPKAKTKIVRKTKVKVAK
jgi:hypothetical protein